jgi:hypothetical protein
LNSNKIDKITNNIVDTFNAAAGVGDDDTPDRENSERQKQADKQRYQELKRRYELHPEEEECHNSRYLPNNIGTGGFAKYSGKRCNAAGCVLERPLRPKTAI